MDLELEGYFWLPEQPDVEIGGRLTFRSGDGGTLSLLGVLPLQSGKGRIIGRCHDGHYTLEHCFEAGSRQTNALETQTIHVNRLLGGVAYDKDQEPVFDRLAFAVASLTEWVQPSRIDDQLPTGVDENGREYPFVLRLTDWSHRSATVQAGTLTLRQERGWAGDGLRERTLTQQMWFEFELSQDLPLAAAVNLASDIQDLVSIGTNRVAAYDYIHLYHKGQTHNGWPQAARLISPWLASHEKDRRPTHVADMAFTFEDIGGMDGIARWMTVAAQYRSMLGHVMHSRYSPTLVDVRLFFRVAALQGLYRAWSSDKASLRVELAKLGELAGDPFAELVPDMDAWCDKVIKERNNLAHHGSRPMHRGGMDLHYSSEIAYWLFCLCLMRLANFPQAAFDRAVKCPEFRWLREQMTTQ